MGFGKRAHRVKQKREFIWVRLLLYFTELVNVCSSMYQIRISSKDKGVGQEA